MGLDIVAYGKLKKVDNPQLNDFGYPVNFNIHWNPEHIINLTEECFSGITAGLDSGSVYSWSQEYYFRAGSYSFYNEWRDSLKNFAKNDTDFNELINFSDCEGVLGSVVCQKLYNDFERNLPYTIEYASSQEDSQFWLDKYNHWLIAFKVASDNGAVLFC